MVYLNLKQHKKMEKSIQLLKKYGIENYSLKDGKITINGYLDLSALQSADKDFLKGTTINGSLDLRVLQSVDKDFLKGTIVTNCSVLTREY